MRLLIYACFIFGTFFICTSCSYKQSQILFERKSLITDSLAQKNAAGLSNYLIKPQDVLQIRNLQNIKYIVDDAPLSNNVSSNGGTSQGQTYQVEDDGTVALPLIGHIPITGLTRAQAAKKIEDIYRKNLLKDPIIELKIINLKVTILGEIRSQGNYPLTKDKTTLVEMIGQAGGLTDRANEKTIKIIRGNKKDPQITEIDLRDIKSLSDPATTLQNDDIIYIAQNKRAVRGDNLQSFSSIIQPVIILLNTALVIFTLTRH